LPEPPVRVGEAVPVLLDAVVVEPLEEPVELLVGAEVVAEPESVPVELADPEPEDVAEELLLAEDPEPLQRA